MQTIETRRLVFPDTTVLVNFALVGEMSLLERLVAGNGRWRDTVANECQDQSKKQGLPQMRRADDIFGKPWRLNTQAEWVDYRLNQDFFRQASDNHEAILANLRCWQSYRPESSGHWW
ncbi:hypothetical protein [uncultured Tessaracoccus sp.]|uniref:hypothetical protein n=1 Tax=uncultured Tessaracoccus sp. TaxID=905023 RepID=UPI002612767E|nr:hypothetical protein [uncultured Tessaracoccus sp.]